MSGSEDIVGRDEFEGLPAAAPQDAHRVEDTPMTDRTPHFTPGPWHGDDLQGIYAGGHPQHTHNIAGIWDGGQTYETCIANRDLIVAAPDLYDAVRELLHVETRDGWAVLRTDAIIAARAALARARGETSTPIGSIAPQGDANSNASLVDRLRHRSDDATWWKPETAELLREAADELSRLSEQVETLTTERDSRVSLDEYFRVVGILNEQVAALSEQVEKQGKVVETARMLVQTDDARPEGILGEIRPAVGIERIRAALNGLVVVGEHSGLPAAERQEPNGRDDPDSARGNVRQ